MYNIGHSRGDIFVEIATKVRSSYHAKISSGRGGGWFLIALVYMNDADNGIPN